MNKKNPAASIRARLLTLSQQRSEPFEAILIRYGLERLLYRLSQTPHRDDFLFKGGLLLSILSQNPYRPTRDLDLLGRGDASPERLLKVFQDACRLEFPDDGLSFAEEIKTTLIKEAQDYPGVRVQLIAYLDKARLTLQIDVGFGDAVLKPYQRPDFEPLLGLPCPEIDAYPVESILSEKIHALIALGLTTSRMKDIYDLHDLSQQSWSAKRVTEAVLLTFTRRQTDLPSELPIIFTPAFYQDSGKLSQWKAFSKNLRQNPLDSLSDALLRLQDFWWPLLTAITTNKAFDFNWNPTSRRWEP